MNHLRLCREPFYKVSGAKAMIDKKERMQSALKKLKEEVFAALVKSKTSVGRVGTDSTSKITADD